ncbi:MAG: NlpC/P60 family N-terminal domain-containing protein [Syntrophales bacterium]|nr:NlpC/P60 family N-terminal domain-containing protein [Syntrophales bacterium]
MGKRIFFVLIAVLILSGFTAIPEIKDLRDISQDHRTFTERQTEEFSRLDPELQKKSDIFHNEMFFSPWHQERSRYTVDEVQREFDKYGKDRGYGRNGKKHSRSWIRELIANARLEHYPQERFPAITLQNTDLRVLPTSDAHLSNPRNCAFPFDNMQNSGVAANTPVFVSHVSGDKKWVLAETHYAMGWIPARHIALVDADFIKQWESAAYATIIKDKTSIRGEDGKVLFNAPLGSFFPKTGEDAKTMQILIATADKRGMAVTEKVVLSRETAAAKPLKLTADNMAKVANELMNAPYGWGGLDQRRDCSSTLMDMFAPFGIWLPRNSGHQATMTGALINLKSLSPEEKEKMILKQGIPYFTLIWLKGHIMLYIGERDGHPLVFHNFWSVKTRDMRGKTGKMIVGKAAITTLYPGRELRQDRSHATPLSHILGMTLIWPPPVGPLIFPQK